MLPTTTDSLLEYVNSAIEKGGYRANRGESWLVIPFAGEPIGYQVEVYCGPGYISLVGELPLTVDPKYFEVAIHALNEKSLELPVGSFQLNREYGKVQFRLGIIVGPTLPPVDMINLAVTTASVRTKGIARTVLKWLPD